MQETIHIILSSYNTHCASSTLHGLNVALKKYERIIDALEKDISSVDSEIIDEWEKDVEAKKNGLNTALANFKKDTSKIVKNVNKNSVQNIIRLKDVVGRHVTAHMYNLAIKLGKMSMKKLIDDDLQNAIPAFLTFKKLLLEVIDAANNQQNSIDELARGIENRSPIFVSLHGMYRSLNAKIHARMSKMLDTWCMKQITKAETIGGDILDKQMVQQHQEDAFASSYRGSSWLETERRQLERGLSSSGIPSATNAREDGCDFANEVSQLQTYFNLCFRINAKSESVKEFLLRTDRLLQRMSPLSQMPLTSASPAKHDSHWLKAPTEMLQIVQSACKHYCFYFSLMDTVFRRFRFTISDDHDQRGIYEQWKTCEVNLSSFIALNLEHFQRHGNILKGSQDNVTNFADELDFKMLKRMKRHIFSLAKCIEKLKFVHFFEKISVNQHRQSSASPGSFGRRPHRLADHSFSACDLLKKQFYQFQDIIANTGCKSLRIGTDAILSQSGEGGGLHLNNVDEFKALVVPFGLLGSWQMEGHNASPNSGRNRSLATKLEQVATAEQLRFPLILPFSKRLSEFSILLRQFHYDVCAFEYDAKHPSFKLQFLLLRTTLKVFEHVFTFFKEHNLKTKERQEDDLSSISQSSIDADYFGKLLHDFCFSSKSTQEFWAAVKLNSYDNDENFTNKPVTGAKTGIDQENHHQLQSLHSKICTKVREFKLLSSNLQDELVQVLCEKTIEVTNRILSKINLNAKHRSNSVSSDFRVLIDFLANSYVNLMNLTKAKRDSALYLSIAHVKSCMLDTLLPYLEDNEEYVKVSMPGIFNISLAVTSLENFAVDQGVDDLEQLFVPVRNAVKDLEKKIQSS